MAYHDFSDNSDSFVSECTKKIINSKAEIIGFSVWQNNKGPTLKIARAIKTLDNRKLVIFGGPECFPLLSGNSFISSDAADVVVYGEGELACYDPITFNPKNQRIEKYPDIPYLYENNTKYVPMHQNVGPIDCQSPQDTHQIWFPDTPQPFYVIGDAPPHLNHCINIVGPMHERSYIAIAENLL